MPEKILLVCTSTASNVKRALQVVRQLYREPQVDLLCTRADLTSYETGAFDSVHQRWVFPARSAVAGAIALLNRLWLKNYDVVGVLWCLDPGKRAAKAFAFLCGGRRLLVFNENLDCDYLSAAFLKRLVASRAHNGTLIRNGWGSWLLTPLMAGGWGAARLLLFPLRFVCLLASVAMLFLSSAFDEKHA